MLLGSHDQSLLTHVVRTSVQRDVLAEQHLWIGSLPGGGLYLCLAEPLRGILHRPDDLIVTGTATKISG